MTTAKKDGTSKKGVGGLLSVKKDVGEGPSRDSPMGVSPTSEGEESREKKGAGAGGEPGPEQGEGQGEGEGEGEGDSEEKAGQKRKRYITVVEGGKKRKVVDIVGFLSIHVPSALCIDDGPQHSFHPDLQAAIEGLKQAIAKGSFHLSSSPPLSTHPILQNNGFKKANSHQLSSLNCPP
jgi:hypothetical protein